MDRHGKLQRTKLSDGIDPRRERELPESDYRVDMSHGAVIGHYGPMSARSIYLPRGRLNHLNDEEILYHYTSLDAARKIIMGKSIWLTEYKTMNDPRELSYSIDLLESRLAFISEIQVNLRRAVVSKIRDEVLKRTLYFASFSNAGDLLGQWRAYAGQGGLSIGFPRELFQNYSILDSRFSLVEVQYSPIEQAALVDPIARDVAKFALEGLGSAAREAQVMGFSSRIFRVASQIKDPGYSSEREFRLMTNGDGLAKGRFIGRGGLEREYIDVSLNKLFRHSPNIDFWVDTVGVAPSDAPEEGIRSAREIFKECGVKCREVVASSIRYRW